MEAQEKSYSPYKVKDLKIYGSAEWMAGRQKKYQRVYNKQDTSFIYAELSFFNKLFDEKDWNVDITLKALALRKSQRRTELCSINISKKVSKKDHIVYIREGWGNKKKGVYWKKGAYVWQAWQNNKLIASSQFFVEDAGTTFDETNPFFEINSVRLFEGTDDGKPKDERTYYTKFASKETRFVFVEFNINNLRPTTPWHLELKFNFYNSAHRLKGETTELKRIDRNTKEFSVTSGWGASSEGSWFNDLYQVEVIFMERLIAVLPFEVGHEFIEGDTAPYLPQLGGGMLRKALESDLTLEDALSRLNKLIGLDEVKRKIQEYSEYLRFLQLRAEKGFNDYTDVQLHAAFTGNPGTGKTTVAGMLGVIYHKMGVLSSGHLLEVGRAELVGEYIGQTAPKVKEVIKKARGGVLFIDEAYSLARSGDDNKDFGREVIEILIKEMSDGPGDLAVVFAGYPAEMKTFLNTNPGLKSRINLNFNFKDYLPEQLAAIAGLAADEKEVRLSTAARDFLYTNIVEAWRTRDRYFGNGRYIHQLVERAKMNMGLRIMKLEQPESLKASRLKTIKKEDVLNLFTPNEFLSTDLPVDDALLKEALGELNEMIGLKEIKKEINDLIQLVQFYKQSGKPINQHFSLHSVFYGKPGTGKTTVARIIARIYKALGVLERGHLVECDRKSLVAGYVGQTALKTSAKIDEADGGVLFIDEAYALTDRGHNDFGSEAIETILKRMEDDKGRFAVIVAGYPKKMKNFVESNPGLLSRFNRIFEFSDFSVSELTEMAIFQLKRESYHITHSVEKKINKLLNGLSAQRSDYFGNGRVVRSLTEEIIKNQNLRMAALPIDERSPKIMKTILLKDLENIGKRSSSIADDGTSIGYRGAQA